eukprot:4085363-Amphidinium_carterae.1
MVHLGELGLAGSLLALLRGSDIPTSMHEHIALLVRNRTSKARKRIAPFLAEQRQAEMQRWGADGKKKLL